MEPFGTSSRADDWECSGFSSLAFGFCFFVVSGFLFADLEL